ncbi:hypothetical protein MRX96_050077, partial [Rhipicephalus microplus]
FKKNTDRRGTPLPPLLKVLITLRFYGTGAMQTVVGDLVRVSQQFASHCVWEITQAVTGPELQFFDVVASWPGSVHDSRIFTTSRVMALYEQKAVPGVLLADQGYECLPFLMTPLKNPQTSAEKR